MIGYTILITITALFALSSNTLLRLVSSMALIISPIYILLQSESDLMLKVPMIWLLIITVGAILVSTISTHKRTKDEPSSFVSVINKGAWLLSVLIISTVTILIIYNGMESILRLLEYSALVKKPIYLHLDTLIEFAPLVIFSVVGVLLVGNAKGSKTK